MEKKEQKIFYVYAYLDPRKPGKYVYGDLTFDYEPFYIGKGHGQRITENIRKAKRIIKDNIKSFSKIKNTGVNWKFINKIKSIHKQTGNWPITIKLKINLKEKNSYKLEKEYIKTIGRHDLNLGPLCNLIDGGYGGTNPSKRTKDLLRKHNLGKKLSIETKMKMSKTRSNGNIWNYGLKGKKNPLFGLKRSKETIKKMSDCKKGKNNPRYGIKVSNKTRKKMSQTRLKKNKKKYSYKLISPRGTIYIVNGLENKIQRRFKLSVSALSALSNKKYSSKNHKGWKCIKIINPRLLT